MQPVIAGRVIITKTCHQVKLSNMWTCLTARPYATGLSFFFLATHEDTNCKFFTFTTPSTLSKFDNFVLLMTCKLFQMLDCERAKGKINTDLSTELSMGQSMHTGHRCCFFTHISFIVCNTVTTTTTITNIIITLGHRSCTFSFTTFKFKTCSTVYHCHHIT